MLLAMMFNSRVKLHFGIVIKKDKLLRIMAVNMRVAFSIIISVLLLTITVSGCSQPVPQLFNGERAYEDLQYQVGLGPRTPGSVPHDQVVEYIVEEMEKFHWDVEVQNLEWNGKPIQNVVAKIGQGQPWIIVGAHYDSRIFADHDPNIENQILPVPGANDGASGVSVLLELARILPGYYNDEANISNLRASQVWLVFFDAEDNGNIQGWDWILGSRAFADNLS